MEDRGFRRSLGEFATGVAVVTARGKGRYRDLVDESEREPTWPLPIHY
jgi:hypothetical protein